MRVKYNISIKARDDLDSIWEYIAKNNPQAAVKVEDEILAAFAKLADNPFWGHAREDLTDEFLRFWPIYTYQIIYIPEPKPIEIVRVLSGYQDIMNII